jgi:DNA-binding NtrC family response regulator
MSKILILDDEPSLKKLLGVILKDEGFDVDYRDVNQSFESLIESIEPSEYEAIFCDYLLGSLEGCELLLEFSKRLTAETEGSTKLILMSAITPSPEVFSVVLALGASFLKKPFSRSGLMSLLRQNENGNSSDGLDE